MMQGLTADDFQHVHEELMRHKELIYELKEKCRKYEAELQSKAAATKARSGLSKLIHTTKDVDLQRENDILNQKLAKKEEIYQIQMNEMKSELAELRKQIIHSSLADSISAAPQKTLVCRSTSPMPDYRRHSVDETARIQELCTSTASQCCAEFDRMPEIIKNFSGKLKRTKDKLEVIAVRNTLEGLLTTITESLICNDTQSNTASIVMLDDEKTKDEQIEALNEAVSDLKARLRATQKKSSAMIRDLQRELKSSRSRGSLQHQRSDRQESFDMITEDRSVDSLTDDTKSIVSHGHSWQLNENRSLRDSFRLSYHGRLLSTNDEQRSVKMTNLQSERDVLAEKVKHLEASNASMASDIVHKSKIIQQLILGEKLGGQNSLTKRKGSFHSKSTVPYVEVERLQKALESTLIQNFEMEKVINELRCKLNQLEHTEEQ